VYFSFGYFQYYQMIFHLFRTTTSMLLLLTIIFILLSIILVKFGLPIWRRHSQLQKDYRSITLLPTSSIPFIGNLKDMRVPQYALFRLCCKLSKECQDRDKGLFCFWYSLWPMLIVCSGRGLEVSRFYFFKTIHFFN
jgi:hypothetical protein